MFGVADFEKHWVLHAAFPRVARDEMEVCEAEMVAVLSLAGIRMGNIDDVALDVFAGDKPWAAAQSEPLALADGVKPITMVAADDASRFPLDDVALLLAQKRAQVVVVVDFAQETDTLAVATVGGRKVLAARRAKGRKRLTGSGAGASQRHCCSSRKVWA